jgi:hypothetical protein
MLHIAKSNLGSIIQDIVIQHSVNQNKKIPSDSVLYKFDKFLGPFAEHPTKKSRSENTLSKTLLGSIDSKLLKPQFKEFIRKLTLPRNVVLDYKKNDQEEEFKRRDRTKLETIISKPDEDFFIKIRPKKITEKDKIDILYKHLRKEEGKKKNLYNFK